ncbi:MAG: RNA-binding cell elongation regulator Jag/EloR [Lachnospiraceae bacterium]
MEFVTISAKTVTDAVTEACTRFDVTSDKLEYTVVEEGKSGILGIGSKPAVISVRVIEEKLEDKVKAFLDDIFAAMKLEVIIKITYDEAESTMNIDLVGDEMGVLIGKRGQTLDSLQYLVSLVANKGQENFIRVKVDTENYRERRKDTLENLAKNIANKVKRTRRSFALEPMNPYERRIIHAALQGNKYVTTHSDGDEPFRHVVVSFKR